MKIMEISILFITALVMGVSNAQTPDGFTLYDDFSDRSIDPERWIGSQAFEHVGDVLEGEYTPWASYDLKRMIVRDPVPGKKRRRAKDGMLHLINAVQGVVSEEVGGVTRSRVGYGIRDDGIVGVGGLLRFHDCEVYGTTDDCNRVSRSRLRIVTTWFNTQNTVPIPGDLTGEVLAYVALRRAPDFPEGQMRVEARIFECPDPDCIGGNIPEGPSGDPFLPNFGFVEPGEDVIITMEWDKVSDQFIFRYEDQIAVLDNPWEVAGPSQVGIYVQVALDAPVCETAPAYTYLNAVVDEVYVKYED